MTPKTKTKLIRGLLTSVSSQRTQYKPYSYNLDFSSPVPIYVEMEVPVEDVVDVDETASTATITINLNGLKAILSQTADAIDELEKDYNKRYQK